MFVKLYFCSRNLFLVINYRNSSSYAVVILAAGLSSRMLKPKYSLKYSENQSFLEHIIEVYIESGFTRIIVVLNQEDAANVFQDDRLTAYKMVQVCVNEHIALGRFYSVCLGLNQVKSDFCFIQNIDNPFITAEIIDILKQNTENDHVIIPVFQGRRGHPVVVSAGTVSAMLQKQPVDSSLKQVLAEFQHKEVSVSDPGILININTPTDYSKYFSKNQG